MIEKNYRFEAIRKDLRFVNQEVLESKYFVVQSTPMQSEQLDRLSQEVFADEIIEDCFYENFELAPYFKKQPVWVVNVEYLPGVTDNSGQVAQQAVQMVLGLSGVEVSSGRTFYFMNDLTEDEIRLYSRQQLANPLIEHIDIKKFADYKNSERFTKSKKRTVSLTTKPNYEVVELNIEDSALVSLSLDNVWALTLEEMKIIREHFQSSVSSDLRLERNLPIAPTNVELEILAQTWSEHCKHKIFAADIKYQESSDIGDIKLLGQFDLRGIYPTFIKGATKKIEEDWQIDWLKSVFSDNAGIVRFSDKVDLSIKVETHNSPSALDPYGGALTGIVGVNRDILGVGLGSRPIANTNVLCFAPPTWPNKNETDQLPVGLLHPNRVLKGVHKGIEDGGNKSGIPTVNGAFYFDYNYAGKPLVYCGTLGVMPQKSVTGKSLIDKNHAPGDRVVMVGGKIGVDGVHGATFSSMELDENSPSTAVQIGDPLTQRKVTDFMMKARDLELYSAVTDNGAGGLSSSIGEMAEKTNGACIDVAKAPTKYPGVSPFELIVSESQERMSFAVPTDKINDFLKLAKSYDVDATDIGEFTDSGFFEVKYQNRTVAFLEMEFLHDGLPKMQLNAEFQGEQFLSFKEEEKAVFDKNDDKQLSQAILKVLGSHNVRSKESLVRHYDHEVQAATIIKPFVGEKQIGPGNSGVVWLKPHGGNDNEAVAIGCGMNPRLSYYDTYLMTQYAFDEAIRNLICQGVDPNKIATVDNFCWPDPIEKESNPDGKHKLAQLVRSGKALFDIANDYGMPLVSGKDSMKNDFVGKMQNSEKVKISVPPTLLMTAIGYIPDINNIITSEFKNSGDYIFLIGERGDGLRYSEYHRYFQSDSKVPAYLDTKKLRHRYQNMFSLISKSLIKSCHDISEGGLACALAESCIGSDLGAFIEFKTDSITEELFSELGGRFVVSVSEKNLERFKSVIATEYQFLGRVTDRSLIINNSKKQSIHLTNEELVQTWRRTW